MTNSKQKLDSSEHSLILDYKKISMNKWKETDSNEWSGEETYTTE